MIPRRDGIALGSTHERGEWSLEPRRTEMHRVMDGYTDFWARWREHEGPDCSRRICFPCSRRG